MVNAQEIHVLYKNLGETPKECLERFRGENPEYKEIAMTYAGRLDPMAEGLLLVLSGEKVNEKEKYLAFPKTYVCEMLWGFETDTQDLLGMVVESEKGLKVESEEVETELKKCMGKLTQAYPAYSSKPVLGKPLFRWAREGKLSEIEIPTHEVEIFKAQFLTRRTMSSAELLGYIVRNVSLVKGDFRQEEIVSKWKATLSNNNVSKTVFDTFTIDAIELKVSSGFYVRQFISDLARKFGAVATTFHIKRTRVGNIVLE